MQPREIIGLDPLVSDMACHTRSPYLISLAPKAATLSEDERAYLSDCALLTSIKSTQYDAFNIIVEERSNADNAKIGALKDASKKKLNKSVTEKKASVAAKTIAYMRSRCKDLKQGDLTDLGEKSLSLFGVSIPLLSFYLATKMALHTAAVDATPVVVFLKRIKFTDNSYELDGCRVLAYDFSTSQKCFAPATIAADKACMVFEMFSCFNYKSTSDSNSFLAKSTFDEFLLEFSQQDIATLIMILAAGHCQYPSLKKEEARNDCIFAEEVPSPTFKVDLFSASKAEYQQLATLARQYGMFGESTRYTVGKRRTDKTVPISVDHVYSATFGEIQNKCLALEIKCKDLIEKSDITSSRGTAL